MNLIADQTGKTYTDGPPSMSPFYKYVSSIVDLVAEGKALPLGSIPPQKHQKPPSYAPVALIFSPHPDDECLIGGFPLRLMREAGMRVVNVAVAQGSNRARQQARSGELQNNCKWLGWELEQTRMPGWLQDNVRRGPEVVCRQGGVAPDFTFATLYRVRQWRNGRVEDADAGDKQISKSDPSVISLLDFIKRTR